MLGARGAPFKTLLGMAIAPGPSSHRARMLALLVSGPEIAQELLRNLAQHHLKHDVIWGSGLAGDPVLAEWLISQMQDEDTRQIASDALALITGIDILDPVGLEGHAHEARTGTQYVKRWWTGNRARFKPGHRYFMGAPVTRDLCLHVLKTGTQSQRILAAHHLSLLNPGTPLFNTSAPAWRQQRLLSQM